MLIHCVKLAKTELRQRLGTEDIADVVHGHCEQAIASESSPFALLNRSIIRWLQKKNSV